VSTTSIAQSAFEGFYGQIGVGYESAKATSSNAQQVFADNPSTVYPLTGTVSTINTFTQNIGFGYTAKLTDKFLLGIGADYNPFDSNSAPYRSYNPDLGTTNNSYKKANTYNIFLIPSYAFSSESLGYVKAGYSATQLKVTYGPDSVAPGKVDKYNLNGYVLGADYKQFFMKNIYGFAEANYMSYSSINATSVAPSGNTTTTNTAKLGLSSYNFLVGIGYKF
jgi:hypothetical protein